MQREQQNTVLRTNGNTQRRRRSKVLSLDVEEERRLKFEKYLDKYDEDNTVAEFERCCERSES